ncbi:hypothetical protein Clacol_005328 [Clathrus columnatus]|uniref:Solute carrier family 35 member F2 n=1 Tax=Clathrus columnatus TaxID=1419009 RepID=A0AAV5ABY4_9AGAM|nr:hypothetical protein Clacol_005328 [Clathrus columnatus]
MAKVEFQEKKKRPSKAAIILNKLLEMLPPSDAAQSELVILDRPPINYDSLRAFWQSSFARFKSLWTRRFVLALLAGQLVSLCITCTNVTTTELVSRNWANATTQTFFLYFSLFVVYTPYTMYRYGFKGWAEMVFRDGWKYFILAACDVEGNFLVVKAYQYTTLLSCMLLDAWAIPMCLFFAWLYMRPKYHWTQLLGIAVCIGGLGMLVASDKLTQKDYPAVDLVKGDIFMIIGATLYGFTNATEEFFVRRSPLYEVVGMLGMWGTLINGIQAAGLEHKGWVHSNWRGDVIGLLFAYTAAMFILYTVAPWIYRLASSAYYNISLLTSDFYGLIFGLFLFVWSSTSGMQHVRYCFFFLLTTSDTTGPSPFPAESQGKLDPQAPEYVRRRQQAAAAMVEEASIESPTKSNEDIKEPVLVT